MCDPLSAISAGMFGVGAGLDIFGGQRANEEESAEATRVHALREVEAEEAAVIERVRADQQIETLKKQRENDLGALRRRAAGSGAVVNTGSYMDLAADLAAEYELDIRNVNQTADENIGGMIRDVYYGGEANTRAAIRRGAASTLQAGTKLFSYGEKAALKIAGAA